MDMDVNSLEVNLLVTLLVAELVFLLPGADRRICRRLRLNLEGGLSENPDADRLLRLRLRVWQNHRLVAPRDPGLGARFSKGPPGYGSSAVSNADGVSSSFFHRFLYTISVSIGF